MPKFEKCPVCGGENFQFSPILWQELIDDWELNEEQVDYMNRQQGFGCDTCGNNLRSMAIAHAITCEFSGENIPLNDLVKLESFASKRVLEVNTVGNLTSSLDVIEGHKIISYPEYDFQNLNIEDESFDLVLHSDTLEHIENFKMALSECHRVLSKDGCCIFTVPLIYDRLTRSRKGLKNSYHGAEPTPSIDYLVHTEFGADIWTFTLEAGFREVTMINFDYPAGLAIKMRK